MVPASKVTWKGSDQVLASSRETLAVMRESLQSSP